MRTIRNLGDLKIFFKKYVKIPIIGIGVTAFNRLGLEDVIPSYQIICLGYSLDIELAEKDIPILSLEEEISPEHLPGKRNSTTVLKRRKTQQYLKSFKKKPALLFYKVSSKIEKICQENGWLMIANPVKYGKQTIENKIKFRKILEECKIPLILGEVVDGSTMLTTNFKELAKKYGLPFVIQHPIRGGGKGTFFIKGEQDFENLKVREKTELQRIKVIVAKYIKGPSPSLTGCVTKHGILYTNLQYQLLDIPELFSPKKGSGLFCGHDWTSSDFSEKISKQAYDYTEKLGGYFQKIGYKGIFGLDFVLDQKMGKLYVTECNPRLLGSFPVLPMVQIKNKEIPLLALHILEFLNIDYEIDIDEINQMVQQKKTGAQMIIHNLEEKPTKIYNQLKAGVYRLENNELSYQRPGYSLKHLRKEDEFVICDGVPFLGTKLSENERIMRILTLNSVLGKSGQLSPWAKKIVKLVYQSLDLKLN